MVLARMSPSAARHRAIGVWSAGATHGERVCRRNLTNSRTYLLAAQMLEPACPRGWPFLGRDLLKPRRFPAVVT